MYLWGFLEDISIWFSRPCKEIDSHQWASFNLLRAQIGKKRKNEWRANFLSLLELEHSSFPAIGHWCYWFYGPWTLRLTPATPWFSGLWTWIELYHQLSWFSSLQMADCGISRPPSIIAWTNAHNKTPLYLLLPVYPIGFLFFLENTAWYRMLPVASDRTWKSEDLCVTWVKAFTCWVSTLSSIKWG